MTQPLAEQPTPTRDELQERAEAALAAARQDVATVQRTRDIGVPAFVDHRTNQLGALAQDVLAYLKETT